jgi:hypothetical protein
LPSLCASLVGYLIFGHVPGIWLGAAVIIGSGLIVLVEASTPARPAVGAPRAG